MAQARSHAPRSLVLEGALDAAKVEKLPGVTSVHAEPAEDGHIQVTAALAPGSHAQDALRAAFRHGFDITRFELREPSLHDAFIELTGEAA